MDEKKDRESNRRRNAAIVAVIIIVLVVWFLSIHHEIDVEVEGEGTVSPDGVTVGHLGSATLEFIPDEGWMLEEVLLDGEPVELDDGKLVMRWIVSDHSVKAVFVESGIKEKHTLTVTSDGNGSVSPSGTVSYPAGSEVPVTATPDEGYVIDDVKIDGQSVGSRNVVVLTMDSDHTVEIAFREARDIPSGDTPADPWVDISVDVQIITTGADFGTVEPSGKVRVAHGGSLTVTVSLNDGYSLVSVEVDGTPYGASPVFTVDGITEDIRIDITIAHAVRTYAITASASPGGSITPSGTITVAEGQDVTFAISPDSGYRLSSLTVDGASVGSGISSYTIEDVRKDTVVRATFEPTSPGPDPRPVRKLVSISVPTHPEYCYIDGSIDGTIAVLANYSDGSSETVTGTCTPISWTSPGDKEVTVSYGGRTCTFGLTAPTLSGIEVTMQPSRTVFAIDEAISLDGMVLTAEYADGPSRTVTSWTFSPGSFGTAGTQTATISYEEGTATVTEGLEVTIVNAGGFSCTVVSYSGTKVVNGAVVSFSYPTMSKSLSDFRFDTTNIVPGVKQTIRVEVTNETGTEQDAYVYVSELTGDDVLAKQIALYSGTSQSTVYEAAGRSKFVDLGTIAHGSAAVFELTMEFVESDDNNLAMGKTLSFSVGVFAGQRTG